MGSKNCLTKSRKGAKKTSKASQSCLPTPRNASGDPGGGATFTDATSNSCANPKKTSIMNKQIPRAIIAIAKF